MLLSKYLLPVIKDNPKEAKVISHALMLRAGMIRQLSSGIYAWLPLGIRVLDKLVKIIEEEMNAFDAHKIILPAIQSADLWLQSGRYDSYGKEMLKMQDRHGNDMLYAPTAEEVVTQLIKDNVQSYKSLPLNLYQITWKFRDEIRPRFGVMRAREFLMKDAYSFDINPENARNTYKKMFVCYLNIFQRIGLQVIPVIADTGPIGGDLSHEFVVLAPHGETEVIFDQQLLNLPWNTLDANIADEVFDYYTSYYASSTELHDEQQNKVSADHLIKHHGIEVGHIFYFADKYTQALDVNILNQDGSLSTIFMGSYGIGVSRLLAAVIESSYDEQGIIWPVAIAPFRIIITPLGKNTEVLNYAYSIYQFLLAEKFEVILNDKDDNTKNKLATADLLGIPCQINFGAHSLKDGKIELKSRRASKVVQVDANDRSQIVQHILEYIG